MAFTSALMTLYEDQTQNKESETRLTMEISLNHTNKRNLFSSLPICMVQSSSIQCQMLKLRPSLNHGLSLLSKGKGLARAVECTNLDPGRVVELEATLEDEMNPEERAQWMSSEILREKCGEKKSFVETLECLEREAIMGEDQGKEPNDYNRRAQIFDKSSRVFQALKERSN